LVFFHFLNVHMGNKRGLGGKKPGTKFSMVIVNFFWKILCLGEKHLALHAVQIGQRANVPTMRPRAHRNNTTNPPHASSPPPLKPATTGHLPKYIARKAFRDTMSSSLVWTKKSGRSLAGEKLKQTSGRPDRRINSEGPRECFIVWALNQEGYKGPSQLNKKTKMLKGIEKKTGNAGDKRRKDDRCGQAPSKIQTKVEGGNVNLGGRGSNGLGKKKIERKRSL